MKPYKIIVIIIVIILILAGGFFLFKISSKTTNQLRKTKMIAQMTPPPTQPMVQIQTNTNAAVMKSLSFPSFTIKLMIPTDLKNAKDVNPFTENTEIGSNYMSLYTPDTVFDTKKHIQTAGVKLSINLIKNKKELSDKKNIVSSDVLPDVSEDMSILPLKSAIVNNKNTTVYVFPLNKTTNVWAYNVESLITNAQGNVDLTLFCVDYSYDKTIATCKNILKKILPTIQS